MKIKVVQFNMRTGFRETEPPYSFEGNRIEIAKKLIKNEKPDLLILNEAYFESENESGILMDYSRIFGFPHYAHGDYKKGLSPFWGCAVLSKYPIINQKNNNKDLGGFFSASIKIKEKVLNLDVTHISPIPFLSSLEQKKFVNKILKNRKSKHYILTGDFNSLSPDDEYDQEKLTRAWSKFEKDSKNVINEMLKKDAVKLVLSNKLIDTYKIKNEKFDFTIPTDYLSKDKSSGIRIDYIFCSSDFKVISSGIVKNKLAEQASDHYPTYAILEI